MKSTKARNGAGMNLSMQDDKGVEVFRTVYRIRKVLKQRQPLW